MKLKGATIPDAIVERVIARCGAEHCFADLDPSRTALVVIDLQHAFMTHGVGHAVCPAARDIVPTVTGWRRWYGSRAAAFSGCR